MNHRPVNSPDLTATELRRALRAYRGRRIAVIGDVILDTFLWGDATRISPEAPVPVVLLNGRTQSLGGAANVAANIAALGGCPVLFAVRGADWAGERLEQLAQQAAVIIGAWPQLADRPTTVKYRVFARNKHLLRVDRETSTPIPPSATRTLLQALRGHEKLEAVVISDYAKGTVTPALVRRLAQWCSREGIPWCVDPKKAATRYRDATVVKPNLSELEALSGLPARSVAELRRAAARAINLHGCKHLLVTRGSEGMALFGRNGSECLVGGTGEPVADVTGAGDTVSAVLGLGLAAQLPLPKVMALANQAAGIVVRAPGVAVVRAADLEPGSLLK